MKQTLTICCLLLLLASCQQKRKQRPPIEFTTEVMNPMTPVKNQGKSQLCWAYSMLAAIETEHIARGDSVNLSPAYIGRMTGKPRQRGMGHTLLRAMERHGMVGYDVYPDDATPDLPVPRQVFMLGARYTPREFAHSVCAPDEWMSLTTTDEHPYGKEVVLDLPDNWEHGSFLNVPKDTLMAHVERALRRHHGVCWEGDTAERGFSFERGLAVNPDATKPTDNHCMAVVGLARDPRGRLYYVMKNSWGTDNPYGGLMYMSADYMREKTIAIYMTKAAYNDED